MVLQKILARLQFKGDDSFLDATIYYYSKTQPTSGYYWHFDADGNIVEW